MKDLLKVSLRQQAIFVPYADAKARHQLTASTCSLVSNLAKSGYMVSEDLLHALNLAGEAYQQRVLDCVAEVLGMNKNWTPLVKGWNNPTGETYRDHVVTFFANLFNKKGTKLKCGHIIPEGTFPLERYNGCPFCGTPFEFGEIESYGMGSTLKVLELWTMAEAERCFINLLTSKTALDATQADTLKRLLSELPLPKVEVTMKETAMLVTDSFVAQGRSGEVQSLFQSPVDILRYLWYKHTGHMQLIKPKVIVSRKTENGQHVYRSLDRSVSTYGVVKKELRLQYNRKQCKAVARWMNGLEMNAFRICEAMHPKREMWVRFIRALRLVEYSRRNGFEKLKEVLHLFHTERYEVFQGSVDKFRRSRDAERTFALLKQRPGMFARSLFANMLWFGPDKTVEAFGEVADQVPSRLVFTLNMYAETYFVPNRRRLVKPLGGVAKSVNPNYYLGLYTQQQLEGMKERVKELSLLSAEKRFAAKENRSRTIYIDPELFSIPLSIGDRSETVQDNASALMGTRFAVEGSQLRLFMQWGKDMPAMHLDMDLSCEVAYDDRSAICSFSNLVTTGCKHSGDIRSIPHLTGTAEYIEIDLDRLTKANARYVYFTCNAYSNGGLSPNLVVGWMNSQYPIWISSRTGVAYDPSCVQHQVRIVKDLTKGLVFGVLDVKLREIIWLEMPFSGQLVQNMKAADVQAFLQKLRSKLTIGQLLQIKAKAQNLQVVETAEADEVYTREWARDTAGVTQLLE
jgi:hypothetical protein